MHVDEGQASAIVVIVVKRISGKIEKKLDFLTAVCLKIMLNDSFVQSYQSVAWQDDCADVIVHSSKFSPQ